MATIITNLIPAALLQRIQCNAIGFREALEDRIRLLEYLQTSVTLTPAGTPGATQTVQLVTQGQNESGLVQSLLVDAVPSQTTIKVTQLIDTLNPFSLALTLTRKWVHRNLLAPSTTLVIGHARGIKVELTNLSVYTNTLTVTAQLGVMDYNVALTLQQLFDQVPIQN